MRRSSAQNWAIARIGALCVLSVAMLSHAGEPAPPPAQPAPAPAAAPAPAPEVSWEAIEAWASGNPEPAPTPPPTAKPEPAKTDTKPADPKPADPRTVEPASSEPKWQPSRPGEHRPEPKQIAPAKDKFLRTWSKQAESYEIKKDWDNGWRWQYRYEHYQLALQDLYHMMEDKHFKNMLDDGSAYDKMLMTNYVCPQIPRSGIDKILADWKKGQSAVIRDRANSDPDYTKQRQKQDQEAFAKREAFHQESIKLLENTNLLEWVRKQEIAGEQDSKALYEVGVRLGENAPYGPLHFMSVLYKLREWYPDLDCVKSGEVQWRLVKVLNEDLQLWKEAADEAEYMCETHPKHSAVLQGEALWVAADARHRQGDTETPKSAQLPIWFRAREKYKEFTARYPRHHCNQTTGNSNKTPCQNEIESLDAKLRSYKP